MKKIKREDLTAAIPFPHDWQRKAIASLYSHAGLRTPLHLLPPPRTEIDFTNRIDR